MDSSHEKIIKWVDDFHQVYKAGKYFNARFAIWEINLATDCNPRTIARVLEILREIKLVGKMPRGYKHKYWEVTRQWTNAVDVIAKYEISYIMRDEV